LGYTFCGHSPKDGYITLRIAILEDDQAQLELLCCWLKKAHHDCLGFTTGASFQNALQRETFDLLVIDWNLPDTSGPEVLTWVRETLDWRIPVLFTTSHDREEDIVHALHRGADDYMIKPIKRAETLARITALLRRSLPDAPDDETYLCPPFEFDLRNERVTVSDQPVNLTHKEFQLALLMFRNTGRLLSRGYILESVWGIRSGITTRTVDTHVSRIRNKLGIRPDRGWRLNAVYHHGYRLEASDPV
jgi:DNA-binding response OmpR family regulator